MGFNSGFKGLKKVQKEEFSTAFQKLYDRAKACIYASGAYFELKKVMCLPHVFSIFKKISAKLLDRTVHLPWPVLLLIPSQEIVFLTKVERA
jgi:hypothetical protein